MSPALDLFRLDGKVALVTGGAGIYGSHIVRALAEAGATVVVASRDVTKCQAFADELRREDLAVDAQRCDLAAENDIRELRDWLTGRYGKLDVLINNAVARGGGDLHHVTAEQWESVMKVNSTGLMLACRILSEPMQAQRSGSIVNISSIYGMVGPDFSIYEGTSMMNPADYAFAKGGMINFTRYLASFLAPFNIRVNCLSPGGFETEGMPESFLRNYKRKTLLRRMAEADDIKGPVIFLASEASRYITGQNIAVDGGWTAT
ncbi:MAG: SDR family oxidoreductase [Bryobacteraceae bacterium]|nr:SDR family oxidoreductase [Bryobacterales bacterium]MEB2364266.1 SDR family oxidoreductase [Bryobacterales bacterium]NUN00673.1 SDR family oxidoreductase [Bryobacteraceae bacterium]